jgi:hypothetical protein
MGVTTMFTEARLVPASAWRSYLFVKPNLNPSVQRKVSEGNRLAAGMLRIMHAYQRAQVAGTVEQPTGSWMLELPGFRKLLSGLCVEKTVTECRGARARPS